MEELAAAAKKVLERHKEVQSQYTSLFSSLKRLIIAAFIVSGVFVVLQSKNIGYLIPAMYFFNLSLYAGLICLLFQKGIFILLYAGFNLILSALYYSNLLGMLLVFFENFNETEQCYAARVDLVEVVLSVVNGVLIPLIAFYGLKLHAKLKEKDLVEYLLMEYSNIITERKKLYQQ